MRLSLVIPCYNEEKNIPLILDRFQQVIYQEDLEILLVNNGSTDHTADVLEQLLPTYPFARTILVPINQGYGYGIRQGLKEATGMFIGWTHADMQTDPADVIKAYHILEQRGWDTQLYIKGKRKGRSTAEQFFTAGMGVFETLYLKKLLWDVNAQPNLFSREFFHSWQNPPDDFALDLYAYYMARVRQLKIVRFSVQFPPRVYGTSHWNTGWKAKWKFIRRTISFSQKMKKAGIQ